MRHVGPGVGDVLSPLRGAVFGEVELEFLGPVDELAQHQLGVADDRQIGPDLPSDAARGGIDLDVLALFGPRPLLSEMPAGPAPETEGPDHVRVYGQSLL